jgi:hypothetical protein
VGAGDSIHSPNGEVDGSKLGGCDRGQSDGAQERGGALKETAQRNPHFTQKK